MNYMTAPPLKAPWYTYKDSIKDVVLDTISSIGAHAFDKCDNIEAVHLLSSSTKIVQVM